MVELIIGNMRILKIICILFCFFSLVSAFTGLRSMHASVIFNKAGHSSSAGMTVTKNIVFRIYSFFNAVLFAAAFYGIQKRKPATWRFGWFVMIFSSLSALISALSDSLCQPTPSNWIASSAIVLGTGVVLAFWGFWWKRQKAYFLPMVNSGNQ